MPGFIERTKMLNESIKEKGIVITTKKGFAEIALIEAGSCEECTAKIFCKPSDVSDTKILEVSDPFGVQPGDEVEIRISGSAVMKASMILYGIPLIMILTGILLGMSIFKNTSLPEVFSFLFGLGLTALYVSLLFLFKRVRTAKPNLPRITFVKRL